VAEHVVTQGQRITDALALAADGDAILLAGTFVEDVRVGKRVTIQTKPGSPRASIVGRIYVPASDVVLQRFFHDTRSSSGLPSPTIGGDRVVVRDVEVTNANKGGIGFSIGLTVEEGGRGPASDVLIEDCRVHHVGSRDNHDHGVYAESASRLTVRGCLIYGCKARGVQLYPDVHDSLIYECVIDRCGEGVNFGGGSGTGGSGSYASSNNSVRRSIISNAKVRSLVESYWSGPQGSANLIDDNVLWPTLAGYMDNAGIDLSSGGVTVGKNVVASPGYRAPTLGDFSMPTSSQAYGYGPQLLCERAL